MSGNEEKEPGAPGWDAIDRALSRVYGRQEPPFHYGTVISYMLGGQDPLHGISVYRRKDPVPHWHFVTYGFTELWEAKESDDAKLSGYGFELTFRLKKTTKEPPSWVLNMLQNLGRYVFGSGIVFEANHYLDCQGKLALEEDTRLCAIAFLKDPELKTTRSPHGSFQFLQIFGITSDELGMIRRWNTESFL